MRSGLFRLFAGALCLSLIAAPMAQADWHGHGDFHGDRGWHGGDWHGRGGDWHGRGDDDEGGNGALAGALIGLGLGAVLGSVIASQPQYAAPPPPVVAAPPPAYYPPPNYGNAPALGYGYPAPQGYYAAPSGR